MSAGPAHHLLEALAVATQALAEGDPIAASAALDVVVAACAALERQGVRLQPETLRRAMELHKACSQAARDASRQLDAEMQSAGIGRRAASAYGR